MTYALDKPKQERSEDFIDGLQVAYKAVYKLQEGAMGSEARHILKLALNVIDDEINHTVCEKATKIITI